MQMRQKYRLWTTVCVVIAVALIVPVTVFAGGTQEAAATEGPITLTFTTQTNYGGNMVDASNDLPVYQEYEKLTGIRIDWEVIPRENYESIMAARFASQTQISDLIGVGGARAWELGEDGLLIPLEDLIDTVGVNIQKFWGREDKQVYRVMATTPDGHIWGIPNYVLPSFLTISTQINKTWLDALGLSEPRTVDEFFSMLVAFRDGDPNGNGDTTDEIPLVPAWSSYYAYIGTWFGLTDIMMSSANGYALGDDGKVYSYLLDPRYREYIRFMNRLWNERLLDRDYSNNTFNNTYEKVAQDIVGVTICWSTFSGTFSSLHPKGDGSGNTPIFIPQNPPVGPHGQAYFPRRYMVSIGGNAITKFSKHPEEAMRWIDIVYASDEALKLQNWGIEGVTYNLVNGEFEPIEKEGVIWSESLGQIGGGQPTFSHVQWGWDTRFPKWLVEANNGMQDYFVDPLPIVTQTRDEIDIERRILPDFNTYRTEMENKFIQGQIPLTDAEFDRFEATLRRLGIDDLIRVMQQRHDRATETFKDMGL